jgi:hypothetical protein
MPLVGKRKGRLKNEIAVWRLVFKDPATPKIAKWFLVWRWDTCFRLWI